MAETLATYLAGKRCMGLKSRPLYFQDGDFVTFFFKEDLAFEERVDELVTVYRSMRTREMVGCKIKGVHRILSTLGNFGVVIDDTRVQLGMLFLGAALVNPARRPEYERISRQYGSLNVDKEISQAA